MSKGYSEYLFEPKHVPLLTKWIIEAILTSCEKNLRNVEVSLTLGKNVETVEIGADYVVIRGIEVSVEDLRDSLSKIDETDIVLVSEEGLFKLAFYGEQYYYKLRAVGPSDAPTLEISGIHMHRIEGVTPWLDAKQKISALGVKPGHSVLDICTGLGYTAIHSVRAGAGSVISIEKDPHVLRMAEYNPWSEELADERVRILLGDACEVIRELEDESFDRIVHDPPRFKRAPELYTLDFYKELYRVLKPGGRLFHYTGSPGHLRRIDLAKGVMERLRKVGFTVRRARSIQGVLAAKPK